MIQQTNGIDQQAAGWAARTDGTVPSADVQRALDAWLAQDTRHLGAYIKVKAVMLHVERHAEALRPGGFGLWRKRFFPERRTVLASLLAASFAALALGFGNTWWQTQSAAYATKIGERRIVSLADGSSVTMNTKSTLLVRYSRGTRSVTLDQGEALFNVAKNKERPFVVNTHGLAIRAVGTRFAVRSLPNLPVEVLVVEGTVGVDSPNSQLIPSLRANSRAFIAPGSRVTIDAVSPRDIQQNLAWRDGRVIFRHQSLASAAKEFARYNRTAIVIDDPAIAHLTVTGAYISNDPVGFAKAVAQAFNLNAVVEDHGVRLTRRGN